VRKGREEEWKVRGDREKKVGKRRGTGKTLWISPPPTPTPLTENFPSYATAAG